MAKFLRFEIPNEDWFLVFGVPNAKYLVFGVPNAKYLVFGVLDGSALRTKLMDYTFPF